MPAKKPSMRENQQRKLTMQKIAKGGPQMSGVKKPAAPKMVNSNSPAMRQIKAKAAAARARAQGKPGITGPVKLPNSVRAGKNLVKAGAQQMRTIGDSPTVRAAAQQGQRAVEAAKRNRARMAAGLRDPDLVPRRADRGKRGALGRPRQLPQGADGRRLLASHLALLRLGRGDRGASDGAGARRRAGARPPDIR